MKKKPLNIGIFAHVDGGKTTITEQLLYTSGSIRKIGRVDKGDTITDFMAVEKERGITVKTATVSFEWQGQTINLLDTPGHMDFIAEVQRSMTVLDGAVLVVSAKEGVQVQTKVIYRALKKLRVPTMIFINKVDRMGVDLDRVYEDIEANLSESILLTDRVEGAGSRQVVITRKESYMDDLHGLEALALESDDFMSLYLEENLTEEVVETTIKDLMGQCRLHPLLHGAALHGKGIDHLLDKICSWMEGIKYKTPCAKVFKIERDRKGMRRAYLRVFGGHFILRGEYQTLDDQVFKLSNLQKLQGLKHIQAQEALAGDIFVTYTNDLQMEDCLQGPPPLSLDMNIGSPTLKAQVEYDHLGHRKEILHALDQLTDEDPFLDYHIHPLTEAIEVHLFGRVQEEILLALMKERFMIETSIVNAQTLYKERPLGADRWTMCMYKDTNLPATIGLHLKPLPLGTGFVYKNVISYGHLSKSYQNGVKEGVIRSLSRGLKGWPVTDLEVTFFESGYDSVCSTPAAFRDLAPQVFEKALSLCDTELLEPLVAFELGVDQKHIGRALADIQRMGGQSDLPNLEGNQAMIEGIVPVDTSKDYEIELADYTSGQGTWMTRFHGYRVKE